MATSETGLAGVAGGTAAETERDALTDASAAAASGAADGGPPGPRARGAIAARPRARASRAQRRVDDEPAFLLHSIPYRETSLVVELFTRDQGRIAAVAKGAKRPRSRLRAVLLAFQPLQVGLLGDRELRTLTACEWVGGLPAPQGDGLLCAFYCNELLMKMLPREDPHPQLFDGYVETIGRLGNGEPPQPVLRRFEWLLLRESGFGVDLRHDEAGRPVDPGRRYAFRADAGFGEPFDPQAPSFSGATLLALADGRFDAPETLPEAKQLTRLVINRQLDGQPLATRQILIDLQKL